MALAASEEDAFHAASMASSSRKASRLVAAASSVVAALDEDTIDVFVLLISQHMLRGRWTLRETWERIRDDGHLQKDQSSITIWLRAGGDCQYQKYSSWTSFQGLSSDTGESNESISEKRQCSDSFVSDPSTHSTGACTVTGSGDAAMLQLKGSGWVSCGAYEDDGILMHVGIPSKKVVFEVALTELRARYIFEDGPTDHAIVNSPTTITEKAHTTPPTRAPKPASSLEEHQAVILAWKRDRHRPWKSAFWGCGGSAHKLERACVMM